MERCFPFPLALASLCGTVLVMILCLAVLHAQPQIPLLLACIIAAGAALIHGCSPRDMGRGVIHSVRQSLQAICILVLIGSLIGVWILAGTVPAMVYYGLQLISPHLFLSSAMLVCAMISMVLGSWGTAGTVGLAFMGMAQAMGVPLPLAAGAVISGSYVGDKLSPLADTTNLAAAVAEVDVMDSIRNIFRVAAPAFVLCLLIFGVVGRQYGGEATVSSTQVQEVSSFLRSVFRMTPLNFLPLLILLVCMLIRVSAIPSLLAGIVSGAVYAAATQHASFVQILRCTFLGYVSRTGSETVDQLLSAGGARSMLYTVSIVLLAMSFGGIMEQTGQMDTLMRPLMGRIRGYAPLMAAATLTSLGTNVLLPDQYIAIALSGQMYAAAFDAQGLSRKDLAMSIGVGGALTSALVPWNTCGIFMSGILGVGTLQYLPFAIYNYGMVLAVILYAVIRQRRQKRRS